MAMKVLPHPGAGFGVTRALSESFGVAPHLTIIFCVKGNWGGQRHRTERLAPYLVESCLSSSSSAPGVLVVLVLHCCLCRFRGLLLGLHLVLWAGLWVHKGEVGGIVRDVAGVGGEREGDGDGRKEKDLTRSDAASNIDR